MSLSSCDHWLLSRHAPERVLDRLRAIAAASGFVEHPASPHRVHLMRARFANATLLGIAETDSLGRFGEDPSALGDALAPLGDFALYSPGRESWIEVEGGARTVELAKGPNGEFRGDSWDSESATLRAAFDPEMLQLLDVGDVAEFAARHLAQRVGPLLAPLETLATMYRRSSAIGGRVAELITHALAQAQVSGSGEVPGIVSFRGYPTIDGGGALVARLGGPLRDRWNGVGDEDDAADSTFDPELIAEIADALAILHRDTQLDLLVGESVLFHAIEFPGYEGRNPRTGEAVAVPPKQALFVHLLSAAAAWSPSP